MMKLDITSDFTIESIKKDFQEFGEYAKNDLVSALSKSMREIVDKARRNTKAHDGLHKDYQNITWNLRESIGGVIMKDHEVIETYFPEIGKGPEGRQSGISYATEVAMLQDDGEIVMVIVAGMAYAAFVEAKGYEVISHSTLEFPRVFEKIISTSLKNNRVI